MKNSRFQFSYRKSASKLHKKIGEVLRTSTVFKNYEIYQEYPVVRVNPNYEHSRHHFDWVIPKLSIVIEGHGKQHFQPVAFDGDKEKAVELFQELQFRDTIKKEAAYQAGFIYVEVPFSLEKEFSETLLLELIETAKQNVPKTSQSIPVSSEKSQSQNDLLQSERHKQYLAKAKEYRRRQYLKFKERRNVNK